MRDKTHQHSRQEYGVFYLPVELEMLVHRKEQADKQADRQRDRLAVTRLEPQPLRTDDGIEH